MHKQARNQYSRCWILPFVAARAEPCRVSWGLELANARYPSHASFTLELFKILVIFQATSDALHDLGVKFMEYSELHLDTDTTKGVFSSHNFNATASTPLSSSVLPQK
jgi:hypothetical protein